MSTPTGYDELVRYIAAEASTAPPQFAPAWADYLLAGYRMTPHAATPPADTRQQAVERLANAIRPALYDLIYDHGVRDTEVLSRAVAEAALTSLPAGLPKAPEPEQLQTRNELLAVPRGTVVRSSGGTIACRYDAELGIVFGDSRPFAWSLLALPVTVLWRPLAATDVAEGRQP